MEKISCLIPVYNEGPRLLETLGKLQKVKLLNKFVVVDDGSFDNAVDTAKMEFPDTQIIKLEENKGKSTAVREGLKKNR